jgi:xanthine dehydrogenase YagS FAD-binding subunit
LKDRNKTPAAMIELTQIDAWKGIKEIGDGIEIGAVTTITEIANNPLVQARYSLLAEAASKVASPQIRNVGTLGGNLNQDARCWHYRRGLACYRAGLGERTRERWLATRWWSGYLRLVERP